MPRKSALTILIALLATVFFVFLRETYWAVIIDFVVDHLADLLGVERARMIAWLAPYAIALTLAAALIVIAYKVGVHERISFAPVPDIDARVAFFAILKDSKWRRTHGASGKSQQEQLVRQLGRDIHNCLSQAKLKAWGEENLARGTGPQREITPDEWSTIEIVFDEIRPQSPRTIALHRGARPYQTQIAYFGVMFCKKQVLALFRPRNIR